MSRVVVVIACILCFLPSTVGATSHSAARQAQTGPAWLQGWPMYGHDPQRSSHTDVVGPLHLHLLFKRAHAGGLSVIGPDGSIYAEGTAGPIDLGPAGHLRWSSRGARGGDGPPALAPNGTLYVTGFPSHIPYVDPAFIRIFAIGSSGKVLWTIRPHHFAKGAAAYVTDAGELFAPFVGPNSGALDGISPAGTVRLQLQSDSFESIAQGLDGTTYAITRRGLLAFSVAGTMLWQHEIGNDQGIDIPLTVGPQGMVYAAGASSVVAYQPDGQFAWAYKTANAPVALAQTGDGGLLVVDGHGLTSLDVAGRQNWQLALRLPASISRPALIVDENGNSYLMGTDGVLHIVSKSGAEVTQARLCPGKAYGGPTLALSPEGHLVVGCPAGTLRVYG